jgi:hypothetical protein
VVFLIAVCTNNSASTGFERASRTNFMAIDNNGLRLRRGDKERRCRREQPSRLLDEHFENTRGFLQGELMA